MKHFMRLLVEAMNDYTEEHGVEALFQEIFPDMTMGELIGEMYEAGMIPEDVIERFL